MRCIETIKTVASLPFRAQLAIRFARFMGERIEVLELELKTETDIDVKKEIVIRMRELERFAIWLGTNENIGKPK